MIQTSEDKENRLWDPYNLKVIFSFPKKQYIQSSCHISQDSNYAISTSNGFQGNGCEITVWKIFKSKNNNKKMKKDFIRKNFFYNIKHFKILDLGSKEKSSFNRAKWP